MFPLLPTITNKLSSFLSLVGTRNSSLSRTLSLKMESEPISKRPTCPTCSKPLALCLCARLNNPSLDSKVHVTILQHSLEKKHPLNSARIAKLGLKNVNVFSVSDVRFEAEFVVRPFGPDVGLDAVEGECTPSVWEKASESIGSVGSLEVGGSRKQGFDHVGELDSGVGFPKLGTEPFSDCPQEDANETLGFNGTRELAKKKDDLLQQSDDDMVWGAGLDGKLTDPGNDLVNDDKNKWSIEPVINITVGKYGTINSFSNPWKLQNAGKAPKFDHIIASSEAIKCLSGGFTVKKLQKLQKCGSLELEQFEEFEIKIPPGSALLFPAQKSVSIEGVDFEVKNLIVLDGTWAKANRIYNENPWLRALPCVKLDINKMSLFSEVRLQPKPGYLSTIESIVYALEALGDRENLEGLHNLLHVFESMVEDQRRCKDERLKKISLSE